MSPFYFSHNFSLSELYIISHFFNAARSLLNIVIDYAIAKKLETSNYSNIPQFIYHSLDVPGEFMRAFGTRLMQLRKYVDSSNASVLLKYIFMEVCSQ